MDLLSQARNKVKSNHDHVFTHLMIAVMPIIDEKELRELLNRDPYLNNIFRSNPVFGNYLAIRYPEEYEHIRNKIDKNDDKSIYLTHQQSYPEYYNL